MLSLQESRSPAIITTICLSVKGTGRMFRCKESIFSPERKQGNWNHLLFKTLKSKLLPVSWCENPGLSTLLVRLQYVLGLSISKKKKKVAVWSSEEIRLKESTAIKVDFSVIICRSVFQQGMHNDYPLTPVSAASAPLGWICIAS